MDDAACAELADFDGGGVGLAGEEQTPKVSVAEAGGDELAARDGIEQDNVSWVADAQGAHASTAPGGVT